MRFKSILVCLAVLAFCAPLFAAETGSVSGIIRGTDGTPLPGVTISISGEFLPAGRSTATEADGTFRFLRLPPGNYTVTAELTGMGRVRQDVVVAVDKDTQVPLTLNPAVAETITVTAATPLVDVKSTEVSRNFTSETLEGLPISRNYKGLFQLAPGVAENGFTAPNAGGNRQDNKFLADGINITNPFFGNFVPNITGLDIKEVNIKRGGVTAEFGTTAGMVVNAVTKSGTNDLEGMLRYEYRPDDWAADPKGVTGSRSTTERTTPAASLGGPILRDRLWYYGSATFPRDTTSNRTNELGSIPDEDENTDEYFLKLTSNPLSNHFLSAAVRSRETEKTNQGIGAKSLPTVASNNLTEYILATFGWIWNLTPSSLIDLKGNYMREENSTDPLIDLGYKPTPFDVNRLDQMGLFFNAATGITVGAAQDAINNQDYLRDEAKATFQTLQDWFGMGHDIRAGITYDKNGEDLERRSNGWGFITRRANDYRARHYTPQPTHKGRGETWGVFVQDQLSVGERTTLNLGVLVNKDEIRGGNGDIVVEFDWDQMIQPRLGVSFVPNLSVRDKVYANFGRYMVTDNKSLGRAGSRTRIFRTDAFFDFTGKFLREAVQSSTTTKIIDPGLDPMYVDEWVAGYARPIGRVWAAEIWGIYRTMHDFLEDVSNDGKGNGPFHVAQLPGANREYEAVTLEANRLPVDNRLMRLAVNASYTWSRLTGNWDLDYSDVGLFYSSSYLQDGPGLLITDNRQGRLRGDRTHVAKLFTTVSPIEHWRLGTYVRFQSGGAWEARGLENEQSGLYLRYIEPAGSRRMDDWLNVDLLTSYEIPFGGLSVELEARVINVFDEQVELEVDDDVRNEATFFATGDPGNPTFGKPLSYSPPRSFILSAFLRF